MRFTKLLFAISTLFTTMDSYASECPQNFMLRIVNISKTGGAQIQTACLPEGVTIGWGASDDEQLPALNTIRTLLPLKSGEPSEEASAFTINIAGETIVRDKDSIEQYIKTIVINTTQEESVQLSLANNLKDHDVELNFGDGGILTINSGFCPFSSPIHGSRCGKIIIRPTVSVSFSENALAAEGCLTKILSEMRFVATHSGRR